MKYLLITRTATLSHKVAATDYPDMTVDEAVAFERDAPLTDKVETMIEAISFVNKKDLTVTVTVDVLDEDNLGEVVPA